MNPPKSDAVWPTVHLRHGEAERIQAGHPWIYARNIQKVTQDPSDGSVVQVRDHRRRFLGVGFFNGQSKIQIFIKGIFIFLEAPSPQQATEKKIF